MVFAIAAILLVLWVMGFLVFYVAGGLIHLVLVIALILFVVQLLRGRTV